ncbi:MAG: glucose-6-phosphate isomerase, partial [Actinobacteria bacterium]|nr:glucose-6-phosphate isomerase [Actinomycetota bacterium]
MNLFALRLSVKDNSLWGDAASADAGERLGWLDLPQSSRTLLPAIDSLAAWARSKKLENVILSGMGGSSLAPEVICAFEHMSIEILDSTDPHHVTRVL